MDLLTTISIRDYHVTIQAMKSCFSSEMIMTIRDPWEHIIMVPFIKSSECMTINSTLNEQQQKEYIQLMDLTQKLILLYEEINNYHLILIKPNRLFLVHHKIRTSEYILNYNTIERIKEIIPKEYHIQVDNLLCPFIINTAKSLVELTCKSIKKNNIKPSELYTNIIGGKIY